MRIEVLTSEQDHPAASLARLAPELAKTMFGYSNAAYGTSQLSLREFEAARIRTAEINGCMVCRGFRAARDLPDYGKVAGLDGGDRLLTRGAEPDESLYVNILNWQEADNYSPRERLAIEFAERMGLAPEALGHDDSFWSRARQAFSDAEIADLAMCVGAWMAGGRVMHALGLDTVCAAAPEQAGLSAAAA